MKGLSSVAAFVIAMAVNVGVAASAAPALPLTIGVSATDSSPAMAPAPSVTFDVSGNSLTVTLTGTPATGTPASSNALSTVFTRSTTAADGIAVTKPRVGSGPQPAFEGCHEIATCYAISGWAFNPQQPDTPVAVGVYADETPLVTLAADQFRRDLLDAGKGNGRHAFTYLLPSSLKDGKPHQIRVKFADSDVDLVYTPKVVNCPRPAEAR